MKLIDGNKDKNVNRGSVEPTEDEKVARSASEKALSPRGIMQVIQTSLGSPVGLWTADQIEKNSR